MPAMLSFSLGGVSTGAEDMAGHEREGGDGGGGCKELAAVQAVGVSGRVGGFVCVHGNGSLRTDDLARQGPKEAELNELNALHELHRETGPCETHAAWGDFVSRLEIDVPP